MRTDKSDINHAVLKNHYNYQAITITLDVEDDPVLGYKTGVPVNRFNICGAGAGSAFHIMEPGL